MGCSAEIVRGATRGERSSAGCGVALLAMFVTMLIASVPRLPDPRDDATLFLVLKLIGVAILGNVVGRVAMRWMRRSKLRFIRSYQHR